METYFCHSSLIDKRVSREKNPNSNPAPRLHKEEEIKKKARRKETTERKEQKKRKREGIVV